MMEPVRRHEGLAAPLPMADINTDLAVARAFAGAAHATRLPILSNRVIVAAMEPRASLGAYDPGAGRYTLRHACQGAFGSRAIVAHMLGVAVERVRILTGAVGGRSG